MNILYLAHRIPYPPNKGDKLRCFRFLEQLSKRHRVWCACYVDTPEDQQYVKPLKAYCEDVAAITLNRNRALLNGLIGLLRGKTLTEWYYRHPEMKNALGQWCQDVSFDVVVAYSSSMARYAYRVPAHRRVLDLCDLDSQKWLDYADDSSGPMRWLYRLEGKRLERKEQWWSYISDATIVITQAEANDLNKYVSMGKLHIITNGVDMPNTLQTPIYPPSNSAPMTIGFVGVMDYKPNVDAVQWFVNHCWTELREAYPRCEFRIVGRNPSKKVQKLNDVPGVTVVGEVKNVTDELRKFNVSIAPMRIARGLQNKVLEAMAAGVPVVLSSKAAKGINGCHDHTYMVADTPDQIIRNISRLFSNPSLHQRISITAKRFVSLHHNWKEILRKFELVATGMIDRKLSSHTLTSSVVPSAKTVMIDAGTA